jgi:translation initiation factor IF-3
MMHVDHGFEMFTEILETLDEVGKLEREPKKLGRRMTMVMAPK